MSEYIDPVFAEIRKLSVQLFMMDDPDTAVAKGAEAWIKRFVDQKGNQLEHKFYQKLQVEDLSKLLILMNKWRRNEAA